MHAVRWPGPLWSKIRKAGVFWMREADVEFQAGEEVELQTPPGRPCGVLLIDSVNGPFVEKGKKNAPTLFKVEFTLKEYRK